MIKCLDAILRESQKLTIYHFERYLVLNGQVKENDGAVNGRPGPKWKTVKVNDDWLLLVIFDI